MNNVDNLSNAEKARKAQQSRQPNVLDMLSTEEDPEILIQVAQNANTNIQTLRKLSKSENTDVAYFALQQIEYRSIGHLRRNRIPKTH